MELQHTVAFSAAPGGGNPCPVILGAEALNTELMQMIARGYGVECAFVLPSQKPGCRWQVRYFTPGSELSMCGHATIAVVTVLVRRGLLDGGSALLDTAGGEVPVRWTVQNGSLLVELEQSAPALGAVADPEEVCRALGISRDDLGEGASQGASTSRMKLMIPLKSRAVLDGLHPDLEAVWALCDHCGVSGVYPFAPGEVPDQYYARQFPCRTGYPEDPATGVAAGGLSAYLYLNGRMAGDCITVYQGFAMGRPSVIYAAVKEVDGTVRTYLRGSALLCDTPPQTL